MAYKHNVEAVKRYIDTVNYTSNGAELTALVANDTLRVHLPKIYERARLIDFGESVYTLGVYAIIDKHDNYMTSIAATMIDMVPNNTSSITIDEIDYYELVFMKGDMIVSDVRCQMQNNMVHQAYSLFVSGGNVPWFMNDEILARMLISLPIFTGMKFSDYAEVIELIVSFICRSPLDIYTTYRSYINTLKPGDVALPPIYVPLKDFSITADSNLNKFMGSYFEEGLTGALTNENHVSTVLEQVLRV